MVSCELILAMDALAHVVASICLTSAPMMGVSKRRLWPGHPSGRVESENRDGNVALMVPETFAAAGVLGTGDGHIRLDIPLTVEGRYDSSNVRGKLNGNGGVLSIHTGDGAIRLAGS